MGITKANSPTQGPRQDTRQQKEGVAGVERGGVTVIVKLHMGQGRPAIYLHTVCASLEGRQRLDQGAALWQHFGRTHRTKVPLTPHKTAQKQTHIARKAGSYHVICQNILGLCEYREASTAVKDIGGTKSGLCQAENAAVTSLVAPSRVHTKVSLTKLDVDVGGRKYTLS